ncbi:hypothetical protein YQE_11545, partial [Dendroctonus ponderosae]
MPRFGEKFKENAQQDNVLAKWADGKKAHIRAKSGMQFPSSFLEYLIQSSICTDASRAQSV